MRVFANGFLPFHLTVHTRVGEKTALKDRVENQWKAAIRRGERIEGLFDALHRDPAVEEVVRTGAQSSLLIPMRMVKGLQPTATCVFSAAIGRGPLSEALQNQFQEIGIGFQPTHTVEGDVPLELSFRDGAGPGETLRLYPCRRVQYRQRLRTLDWTPDALLLNRDNRTMRTLAQRVAETGGTVSLRPRSFGRHDRPGDLLEHLLPHCAELVLSSRGNCLSAVARALHCRLPRDLAASEGWEPLLTRLFERMAAPNPIVLLTHYPRNDVRYCTPGAQVYLPAPPEFENGSSPAARLQGAALALRLGGGHLGDVESFATRVHALAFDGMEQRPWRYPEGRA